MDSSLVMILGMTALVLTIVISDAIRYWIGSFRPNKAAEAADNSAKALVILDKNQNMRLEILLELKDIALCQQDTVKILDKLVEHLEK